ncbi:hypothetical protein X975_17256, partial [Stegodyphus mimosarum]
MSCPSTNSKNPEFTNGPSSTIPLSKRYGTGLSCCSSFIQPFSRLTWRPFC